MIAYYIHWNYPATADDALYYSGEDDKHFFHHKENAIKYAIEALDHWNKANMEYDILCRKLSDEGHLTNEEELRLYALETSYCLGDVPDSYKIKQREIEFEDEP